MHKIRLSDFARAERRSMSYLSHFVKEALGQSFQEYVNTVRFHCACKLIAAGQRRMLDVCVASGFSDYRYFSAAFQKRLGMTPEEYSRQPQSPVLDKCRYTTASIHWNGFIPVKKAWNCWTVSRRNTLPAYKPHAASGPARKACGQISGRKRRPRRGVCLRRGFAVLNKERPLRLDRMAKVQKQLICLI